MIAVDAIFAVIRSDLPNGGVRVLTLLIDLKGIRPHDSTEPFLPSYDEAVRIVTERGLARTPRLGYVKRLGVVEHVPVCERLVVFSGDEIDALALAMG